jgi:hypothetical protein
MAKLSESLSIWWKPAGLAVLAPAIQRLGLPKCESCLGAGSLVVCSERKSQSNLTVLQGLLIVF